MTWYTMRHISGCVVPDWWARHGRYDNGTVCCCCCTCNVIRDAIAHVSVLQARDVFGVESMAGLRGAYGVGHVRYPTSGCNSVEEAQVSRPIFSVFRTYCASVAVGSCRGVIAGCRVALLLLVLDSLVLRSVYPRLGNDTFVVQTVAKRIVSSLMNASLAYPQRLCGRKYSYAVQCA